MKRLLCAAALAIAAAPGVAAAEGSVMNRASEGYVYFHRAGADMAAHDAAVDGCVHEAVQAREPYQPPVIAGVLTQMIIAGKRAAKQRRLNQAQFAANVENCMLARGWDVVRLDDAEGRTIAAQSQPQQSAPLAPWVGAAQPRGQTGRRYADIGAVRWNSEPDDNPGPVALSLTAGVHDLSRLATPGGGRPAEWRALPTGDANTAPAPAASVIVVRVTTTFPAQQTWTFVRLDEALPKADPPGLAFFTVTRDAKEEAAAKTYVIAAPPGRWRLQGAGATSFCLGGPVFDLAAGEAVFAGDLNASSPYALGLDPAAASAELRDSVLAARLKPAPWVNGEGFPCGVMQPSSLYVLELPGAPYAPDYRAGSRVAPAP
jgi:hypothetical protein